jgi:hypothetical protein
MSRARFQAGCLACGVAGMAMCASAQLDWLSTGASSMDTFGGDPDSYAFIWIPPDTADWTRHFRIGVMAGFNISAKFNEQGLFNLSGNNAANGIYDDGYVRPDQSGTTDLTGYWGYNNASQYNSSAQTLTFQSASSYSTSVSSKDDGGPFPGFDMAYGDNLWYWKHARVGWELGFGLLPVTIKDKSSGAATVTQSSYVYDTSGLTLFPDAGYQGGPSGVGYTIPLTPLSTSSQTTAGTVTGSREIEAMLYSVRFGPTFYWDLTEDFGMSLGAGPAVGLVTGTYKYDETINYGAGSARNSGEFGGTDVLFGGYVNGTLLYHVLDDADFYLGAQYMPLGNASFNSGGRQSQLNFGGQVYVSLGINWPF